MKPDDMPVMPASPCSRAATSAALPPAACDSAATASAALWIGSVGPPRLELDRAQEVCVRPRPGLLRSLAQLYAYSDLLNCDNQQPVCYQEGIKSTGPHTWHEKAAQMHMLMGCSLEAETSGRDAAERTALGEHHHALHAINACTWQ